MTDEAKPSVEVKVTMPSWWKTYRIPILIGLGVTLLGVMFFLGKCSSTGTSEEGPSAESYTEHMQTIEKVVIKEQLREYTPTEKARMLSVMVSGEAEK